MARAIIHVPKTLRRGEIVEIRALVQHPMETGYRNDSMGRRLPRDILRRMECRVDGVLVFAADLHAAVAANPTLSFPLRVEGSATLAVTWRGDNGFEHTETAALAVS